MTDGLKAPVDQVSSRLGLALRAVAFLIDLLIVNLVVTAIGLVLVVVTSERARLASPAVHFLVCSAAVPAPAGLALPAGFVATEARACTTSLLGVVTDRRIVLRTKDARGWRNDPAELLSIPVDAGSDPARPVYLDALVPLMLVLMLLLSEWRWGASPGKWLLGIAVRSLDGGPAGPGPIAVRGLRLLALMPVTSFARVVSLPAGSWQFVVALTGMEGLPDPGPWSDVLDVLGLAYLIALVLTSWRGLRAPHDRLAGTDVVHVHR